MKTTGDFQPPREHAQRKNATHHVESSLRATKTALDSAISGKMKDDQVHRPETILKKTNKHVKG